jgi:hypothetical protein
MNAVTEPPLTPTEVLAILADARTWPRCPNCGRPKIAAIPGAGSEETP